MAETIVHKHLILRCLVNKPIMECSDAESFLKFMVAEIGMKLAAGPISCFVEDEGNKGITCGCLIKTSHLVCHFWSETSPALMQFDLYSCADFSMYHILTLIDDKMDLVGYEHKLLDREYCLTIKE